MVVWSRSTPDRKQVGQHYTSGVAAATELGYYPVSSQRTDSYRTRGGQVVGEKGYNELTGTELRGRVNREYSTRYDNGHDFLTEKWEFRLGEGSCGYSIQLGPTPNQKNVYIGEVTPSTSGIGQYPTDSYPSLSKRHADGRWAIGATAPTQQEAGLAAFLGELREQLPQLIGGSILRDGGVSSRNLGEEELNLQFGLLPTKGDLQSLARAILDFARNARQFQRDSDQNVRRRITIDESSFNRKVTGIDSWFLNLPRRNSTDVTAQFIADWGRWECYDTIHSHSWFSGCFTYHLSEAHGFLGKMEYYEQLANHLLGLELTPEVIWQLTPWSWLIDWFSDAGVFVKNITQLSNDNLVLRYGYVMHETRAMRTRTIAGLKPANFGYGPASIPSALSNFSTYTSKIRTRSTPYGFGVDVNALSPTRWAILGALGLTKAPTVLRLGF